MGASRPRLAPVIIYIVIVFLVSSIPSLTAPGPNFLLKDKLAHFIEYFVLGVLLFKAVGWSLTRSRVATLAFLVVIGGTIGAGDELYQSLIPGRALDVKDWYADVLGVAIGAGLLVMTARERLARQGNKE